MDILNIRHLLCYLALVPAAVDPVLDAKWGTDWPFSGLTTFAHLPTVKCLVDPEQAFDAAIIGVPFDTAVSYRTGARFGPRAIRAASSRQTKLSGFNIRAGINPYQSWATITDCMDIPVTPMNNELALEQMTAGFSELLEHPTAHPKLGGSTPKLVALGGDHSIVLPHLRALRKKYGQPISVIHFDAHLDTYNPTKYASGPQDSVGSGVAEFTHGTMFWMAAQEGLLSDTCIHAGLRSRIGGIDYSDYLDDSKQGFARISCDDIDEIGVKGIVQVIKNRIPKGAPVYISVDIDVIDPSAAPGTGTPEVGGWSTRELIGMLRRLTGLNIVGADVVEVAPSYDQAEITAWAGAQVAYELLTSIVMEKSPGGVKSDPSKNIHVNHNEL